jgi:hypothetical protein
MRFRDVLIFSLQLVLPDKAILAFERYSAARSSSSEPSSSPDDTSQPVARAGDTFSSQRLIEELDSAQFGGPSFGQQSIALMAKALDDCLTTFPDSGDPARVRELAQRILNRAADGERDPIRLRNAALGETTRGTPEPDG